MQIDPRFPKVTAEQHEALLEVKQALEAQAPEGAAPDPFAHSQNDGKTSQDSDVAPEAAQAAIEAAEESAPETPS